METRYLLQRIGWTAIAAFLVLSGMFFAVALTPDPNRMMTEFAAAAALLGDSTVDDPSAIIEQAGTAYLEARNKDKPLMDRYWHWITGYATLKLGYSYAYGQPVKAVLGDVVPVTVAYVVPGIGFAWIVSLLGGVYSSLNPDGVVDHLGSFVSHLGLGIPPAVIAALVWAYKPENAADSWFPVYDGSASVLVPDNLIALSIPAAIVGFSVVVVQWPVVRAEATRLHNEEFVRTLRAGGADPLRIGRHLVRNATVPLLELFKSEVLVVLLLTMFVVEQYLGIPGLGDATLRAFDDRDIGLLLATVMLPAFVGLFGTLLADLLASTIDPRVSS